MPATILEKPGHGVAVVRLNRPEARNAINLEMRAELTAHFHALVVDADVRAIVITGDEKAFVGGADIAEMSTMDAADHLSIDMMNVWNAIRACPKPIIAAVQGYALGGGCELAMASDIIVAGVGARFGQPEVRVGIMPGAGGTQRLTRAVGKFQAMRMVLTGELVGAAEALGMGLVSEVVADAEVVGRAIEIARRIAELPPLAIVQAKESVLAADNMPLDAGLRYERKGYQLLFSTDDQKEGMKAFLEKRTPRFKGK
ncbi:MAG: enoyl-CoA hydratase-related protein [Rhodospirillales bacterium]|jgi:enoyl-CoA hydratase/carnithine racemase|nr:enoyl-CoA hydratase-related protein [Rhodospirillales bacterium]MDP6804557.1 enoyl-CoA hydratase-related protein [Rhodospirillales bacterium]